MYCKNVFSKIWHIPNPSASLLLQLFLIISSILSVSQLQAQTQQSLVKIVPKQKKVSWVASGDSEDLLFEKSVFKKTEKNLVPKQIFKTSDSRIFDYVWDVKGKKLLLILENKKSKELRLEYLFYKKKHGFEHKKIRISKALKLDQKSHFITINSSKKSLLLAQDIESGEAQYFEFSWAARKLKRKKSKRRIKVKSLAQVEKNLAKKISKWRKELALEEGDVLQLIDYNPKKKIYLFKLKSENRSSSYYYANSRKHKVTPINISLDKEGVAVSGKSEHSSASTEKSAERNISAKKVIITTTKQEIEEGLEAGATAPLFHLPVVETAKMKQKSGRKFRAKRFHLKDWLKTGKSPKKAIIVSFFATWCVPCKRELPALIELNKQFKPYGLGLLSISIDKGKSKTTDLRKIIEKNKLSFPMVHDRLTYLARRYKASRLPYLLLIDENGIVQKTYFGYSKKTKHQIQQDLKGLLNRS